MFSYAIAREPTAASPQTVSMQPATCVMAKLRPSFCRWRRLVGGHAGAFLWRWNGGVIVKTTLCWWDDGVNSGHLLLHIRPIAPRLRPFSSGRPVMVWQSLELINAYPIDSYLKSENEHAEHPGSQTKTRNFFNFWYDLLSWCKLLYRIRIAGHILSAFTEKTGKIPFLILRIAGSLPGEALAPGVSGPDVSNFPCEGGKNRSRNFFRFFFSGSRRCCQVERHRQGRREIQRRNLTGKCWGTGGLFVCMTFFFWRSWAYGDRPLSLKVVSKKADKSYIWMVSAFLNGVSS